MTATNLNKTKEKNSFISFRYPDQACHRITISEGATRAYNMETMGRSILFEK